MIRYRIDNLSSEQASQLAHPELKRLAGRGPWVCAADGTGVVLTRHSATPPASWGPWRDGVGGIAYSLAEPLPDWDPAWIVPGRHAVPVALSSGIILPVVPVPADGLAVDLLTGELGDPVTPYGQAVADAFDLIADGGMPALTDPILLAAVRAILVRSTRLPIEALAAYALVGSSDLIPLVEAAAAVPKALRGAGGCAAAPPASTPPG